VEAKGALRAVVRGLFYHGGHGVLHGVARRESGGSSFVYSVVVFTPCNSVSSVVEED
jgi:hypothetical protein